MPNIITITLNPALDLSTHVAGVRPGPKLRCDQPTADPGGGGVNVSRAIRNLGGRSLAVVCLGGTIGMRLRSLLDEEGITSVRYEVPGETRQSLSVVDTQTGAQYRFVMPGPEWSQAEIDGLNALIAKFLRGKETIVLSGSQPTGVGGEFISTLNDLGGSVSSRLAVDVSGAPLTYVVQNPCDLWLLRMDLHEARELSGRKLQEMSEVAEFAAGLVEKGVALHVVIGLGADGSVMATEQARFHASCRVENTRSATGAGDSLMGAMIYAFSQNSAPQDALCKGVAAAAAAVMTDATELCTRDDYETLCSHVKLTAL
jgi:6-phosphofructokinase 2